MVPGYPFLVPRWPHARGRRNEQRHVGGVVPAPFAGAPRLQLAGPHRRPRRALGKDITMNTDQLKGQWRQLAGAAKAQWGRLTDDELLQVEGNAERLVGLVQERYGYAKERAQDEVDRFLLRHSTLDDTRV